MLTLRKFNKSDFDLFAVVESEQPLICYFNDETFIVIVDGKRVELSHRVPDQLGGYEEGMSTIYSRDFATEQKAKEFGIALLQSYQALAFEIWRTLVQY